MSTPTSSHRAPLLPTAPAAGLLGRLARLSALQWALLLLGIALLLRLPIFVYPFFNGDEATYSALANALLDGNPLYVGAVDHKPPLIAATYALILGAFGRFETSSVHAVSILVVALTGLLLSVAARRVGRSRPESRLAGLLYVAFSSMGPGKDMLASNAELFMLLPTAGAAALYFGERKVVLRGLGAGVLCGTAFLYKYQGGAILGTLVIYELLRREGPLAGRAGRILLLGAGFFVPLLVLVGYYASMGELEALAFWAWTFPLNYAGKLSGAEVLANAAKMSVLWALPSVVLLIGAAAGLRRMGPEERPYRRLTLLWLGFGLLGVASGGRFFLHYYLQLLPALAFMAAAPLLRLWASPRIQRLGTRRLAGAALALVVLPLAAFWVANAADHAVRPRIPRYTRIYRAVGEWVRDHSAPDDKLLVWGNSPEIYRFSERRMGTRFVFCNYQSGKIWGTTYDEEGAEGTESQAVEPAWQMLQADLEQRRPQWIVDAASGGLDRWRGHEVFRYPRLWSIISRDYERAGEAAGTTIYRRRTAPDRRVPATGPERQPSSPSPAGPLGAAPQRVERRSEGAPPTWQS